MMNTKKRLIDANALIEHLERCIAQSKGLFRSTCVAIKCFVEQIPLVDAVEVVRCKDCKHWNIHPINGKFSLGKCDKLSRGMADTWFCSFGERKDNE